MSQEDLEKQKAELAAAEEKIKKEKEEEEKKKKESEEAEAKKKEEEEDEKLKSIVGDKAAVAAILEAKRKANAEAKEYRLKLAEIEKKIKSAEDLDLEKKGEFEKIADKAKSELKETQEKFKKQIILSAVKSEAIKAGAIDPDVHKLIDISEIKVDNEFNVSGAAEAVAAYKKMKPEFFGEEELEPEENKKATLKEKILGKETEGKKPRELIAAGLKERAKKKK